LILHYHKIDITLSQNWYYTITKLILHYHKIDITLLQNWYYTITKLILHYHKIDITVSQNWYYTITKLILHYHKIDITLLQNRYYTITKLILHYYKIDITLLQNRVFSNLCVIYFIFRRHVADIVCITWLSKKKKKETAWYKVFAVLNSFCFHDKNDLRLGDDSCITRFVVAAMVLQIKSAVM